MELEQFRTALGFSREFTEKIAPHWAYLLEHSSGDFPSFMEESFYREYYPLCAGPAEEIMYPRMAEVARIVRENPAVARYASILFFVNFFAPDSILGLGWESPEALFGKNIGIFHLMVAMAALPEIRKVHAEMGLPDTFMKGVANWISGAITTYIDGHNGEPGFNMSQIYWVGFTLKKKLFRFGRLEFYPRSYTEDLPPVYRHRKTGRLAVFCRDGWAFDEKGLRVDPQWKTPSFTASFRVSGDTVTGTPVAADGLPVRGKEISITLPEWEPLCTAWDNVMTMHIPGGGGMTLESVRDSLIQAREFYKKYFNLEIKLFTCQSWILNPAWQDELPGSNMAKLQRNAYLTPACIADGGNPGLFFIYGDRKCDPFQRPQTTSLHKAVCRILARGEYLRSGCLILPADQVEQIGTEYFRNEYSASKLV